MVFDKEEHKKLALLLIQQANIGGDILDLVYEFKKAVLAGEIIGEGPKKKLEG